MNIEDRSHMSAIFTYITQDMCDRIGNLSRDVTIKQLTLQSSDIVLWIIKCFF